MSKRKRHYPPSRQRYEEANPVISVRVTRDMYGQLKALKEQSGKSVGDVLREALGSQQADTKSAHTGGYIEGWVEAEEEYKVDYRCSICGGTLSITTDNEKEAAATYMREHGWGHGACHKKQGRA